MSSENNFDQYMVHLLISALVVNHYPGAVSSATFLLLYINKMYFISGHLDDVCFCHLELMRVDTSLGCGLSVTNCSMVQTQTLHCPPSRSTSEKLTVLPLYSLFFPGYSYSVRLDQVVCICSDHFSLT